jgi:hypothetical protein
MMMKKVTIADNKKEAVVFDVVAFVIRCFCSSPFTVN